MFSESPLTRICKLKYSKVYRVCGQELLKICFLFAAAGAVENLFVFRNKFDMIRPCWLWAVKQN